MVRSDSAAICVAAAVIKHGRVLLVGPHRRVSTRMSGTCSVGTLKRTSVWRRR